MTAAPDRTPAREMWKSPRELLEERATSTELEMADGLRDRLNALGHHDFAARRALLLDLVCNVVSRTPARVEPAQAGTDMVLVPREPTEAWVNEFGIGPFESVDFTPWEARRIIEAVLEAAPKNAREQANRFGDWSIRMMAAQCRAQAREQLDPEFSDFMLAIADKLEALAATPSMVPDSEGRGDEDVIAAAARRICVVLWGRERGAWETPIWDQCFAIARAALAPRSEAGAGEKRPAAVDAGAIERAAYERAAHLAEKMRADHATITAIAAAIRTLSPGEPPEDAGTKRLRLYAASGDLQGAYAIFPHPEQTMLGDLRRALLTPSPEAARTRDAG